MATFSEAITIDAPGGVVWDTLADVGTIAEWNPGLIGSESTNDVSGLGARRFCDIDGRHNLDEEVVRFEPEHTIVFRITRSTLPFRSADIEFCLKSDNGKTCVTVSPVYRLKYGLIGRLLDRAFVSKAYRQGMRGLLTGLKEKTECN